MILPLQKFSALLENMAAAVQGGSAQLVDVSVGSVLRALIEACAAVALWLQWLILQVLSMTRASTSAGGDLDSWMADFGLARLTGSASAGQVTFSRYTPGVAAVIPVSTIVVTGDRAQSFVVTASASHPAWNGTSGYNLAAPAGGVTVPVQAKQAGTAGNVLTGTITTLATAIPGVDYVTNTAPLAGGFDAEADADFRARFQLYINSRSLATAEAVAFAIESVRQGLRYAILENVNTAHQPQIGSFWVIVDDGTGRPPATLIQTASLAVDNVKALGASFAVTGPDVVFATITMTVMTSAGAAHSTICTSIENAIYAWVGQLPVGGTLAVSKLEALAHGADPAVMSVSNTMVNNAVLDVVAGPSAVIVASNVLVS